jgi:hypothetical protein
MPKSASKYWNPLNPTSRDRWKPVKGLDGIAEELTLSVDNETGGDTRLIFIGADATPFYGKMHTYSEEVVIVSDRLVDKAVGLWLEMGHYASRPAGE